MICWMSCAGQIVVHSLYRRTGHYDTAAAYELFYIITLQLTEKCFGFVVMSRFFYYGKLRSDVEDACTIAAYDLLNMVFLKHAVGGHFVEGHFLIYYVLIHVAESADHVDAFLYLLDHLVHHHLVAVAGDGYLVHSGCGACAGADALYVETPPGEYNRQLVEQSDVVFGEYYYGVECLRCVHVQEGW